MKHEVAAMLEHGLIGLTKAAALDYAARGIRINAICPGIIDTEMMSRFTGGTDEGRAAVIDQEPIGRTRRAEERRPLAALRRSRLHRRPRDGRRRRPDHTTTHKRSTT